MVTVVAACSHCGRIDEIDTADAIILVGTTESVWKAVKGLAREGEAVRSGEVALYAYCSKPTAVYHLRKLAKLGLVKPEPKRVGGKYVQWRILSKHLHSPKVTPLHEVA